MDNNPVTIIVKAPNQQFEDQTIQCELSWTIKRLKGLLSEVYPSKPKTDEQKLIYSGQLLNDQIVLKDILRQYEGQDTHTVHLVLQSNKVFETSRSNKNSTQPLQPDINTDGLRQRNTTNSNSSETGGLFRPAADWSNSFASQPIADMNRQYNEWVTQQLPSYNLMVEQIYRQYYSQYMNALNQPNNLYMSQNGGMNNLPQMPYYPQNYFPTPNLYNSPVTQQQLNNQAQPQVPQPQAAAQPQVPPQQPLPDQQPNPAQQRFPNIVQEEVENRDWLDLFYAFSRLMVLVTLIYFYSSPLRCLIVIFFTILYYGYHVGYFRQHLREPNNNQPANVAPPANNNNENVAAPVVEQQPQQPQQPAADAVNNEENPINEAEPLVNAAAAAASPTDNDDAVNEANRTPMIVLVRTFIMSFFASLIPETPAL
ncbi:hypothetical protein HA402_008052 [Bradysia odoriphaga]|nr:hypothetical protein HA402_008052 [Bradysia odoriphaga]